MKKILLLMLLMASPAWAQTQLGAQGRVRRARRRGVAIACAPIGRTAKGELVYSMKCDNLPAPPPPAQAEAREAPVRPPAGTGSAARGIFGWFYDRRPKK